MKIYKKKVDGPAIRTVKLVILRVVRAICWPIHLARFKRGVRDGLMPSDGLLGSLVYHWGNAGYSADSAYLRQLLDMAYSSKNMTILECGSGLSTLLVGLVADRNGHKLFALEHHPEWATKVQTELDKAGVQAAVVKLCPIIQYGEFDWYDVGNIDLPSNSPIDFVICDGPPAQTRGGRIGLPYVMSERLKAGCLVIADDTHRPMEKEVLRDWKTNFSFSTDIVRSGPHFTALVYHSSGSVPATGG